MIRNGYFNEYTADEVTDEMLLESCHGDKEMYEMLLKYGGREKMVENYIALHHIPLTKEQLEEDGKKAGEEARKMAMRLFGLV